MKRVTAQRAQTPYFFVANLRTLPGRILYLNAIADRYKERRLNHLNPILVG
jgi:hypothetical protein